MASWKRGHRRRFPLWSMYGWNDAPASVVPTPDPVSRETESEPVPAATPAPVAPTVTPETTPSE